MNFASYTDAEIKRWIWLRAIEWETFPAFITQPLVPILFIFYPWYGVLLVVLGLCLAWCLIRYRCVSVSLATFACLFVIYCKWPSAIGSSVYLFIHHQPFAAVVGLFWPLLAGFIPALGKVGIIEAAFARKIGLVPPDAQAETYDPTRQKVLALYAAALASAALIDVVTGRAAGPANYFYFPTFTVVVSFLGIGALYRFWIFDGRIFRRLAVMVAACGFIISYLLNSYAARELGAREMAFIPWVSLGSAIACYVTLCSGQPSALMTGKSERALGFEDFDLPKGFIVTPHPDGFGGISVNARGYSFQISAEEITKLIPLGASVEDLIVRKYRELGGRL